MKTELNMIREKMLTYGMPVLTDNELLKLVKYKGDTKTFYESKEYHIMRELQRRHELPSRVKIGSSQDIAQLLSFLQHEDHEQFWVVYLNKANFVISYELHSKGGVAGTVMDPKILFKRAVILKSTQFIVAHNHPSGNLQPSDADRKLTRNLKEGGALLEIQLLDSVIVSDKGWFSFADDGLL